MGELSSLKGLGPKSEKSLNRIGLYSKADLINLGAVRAYLRLKQSSSDRPSLNFLYALVGAIEDRHWTDISKAEKLNLMNELEALEPLENASQASG